jgi:hypothetical protein
MLVRLMQKALPLLLLAMLAACSASAPQTDPTPQKSTDVMLVRLMESFEKTCIAHAPDFADDPIAASFADNEPALDPSMTLLASNEVNRSCRYYVRGYGANRAMPTEGDVNALADALHARIGGSPRPKTPTTSAGGAQVRKDGTIYNIYAYVNPVGDLEINVSC